MKLYFVRHGKTQWNLEARYQGAGGDSPLLPESYRELKLAGEFLRPITFQHVYASPIKRARVTAEQLLFHLHQPIPLTLLSRLEEFHLGRMEGQTFDEVQRRFPEEFVAFRHHPDRYDSTRIGGESFPALIERMTPAIQMMVTRYPATTDNVLVVSHGAALSAEINALLGVPLKDLRQRGGLSNTSTTILETTDQGQSFQLVDWNDTSYLDRPLTATDTI